MKRSYFLLVLFSFSLSLFAQAVPADFPHITVDNHGDTASGKISQTVSH